MEFTTTRTSKLNQLLVAAMVLTAFEMPALQLALHGLRAHLILLAINVGGIAWLLMDARLMRRSAHRLGKTLEIHLGMRARGSIPLAQIASARLISGRRRGAITPMDPPNVEIALHAPVTLRGWLRRKKYRQLWLFVDEPEKLVSQLMGSAFSNAHSLLPPESASPQ